jgi:peptidoglycan/LPS O-acetylase OafA/YrhL
MSLEIKNDQLLQDVQHLNFVDALRGWAFLAVLMAHVNMRLVFPSSVASLLEPGTGHGVQLFFVVSAFTLFFSLHLRKINKKGSLGAFLIRRFFRIAPMFWAAALFYLALGGFKTLYGIPHEVTPWRVLSTFLFLHGWRPDTINNVVPGGWTIAVEMSFYVLLPLFFKYVTSLKKALICLVSLLAFYVLANFIYAHALMPRGCPQDETALFLRFWLPSQLPVFSLGFILFFLVRTRLDNANALPGSGEQEKDKRRAWILLLISAGIFFCARPLDTDSSFHHLVFGLGFFFLAWALAVRPFSFFVSRFTDYVGKVSYSAYLCHFFVVDVAVRSFFKLAMTHHWPFLPNVYFIALYLVSLAGTLWVSTLTYEWIEVPFQKLGKRIIHRFL